MAKLYSATTTIEISPCKRENPSSTWIYSRLGVEYHVKNQKLCIQLPDDKVLIRLEGYKTLIQKSKDYLESIPVSPVATDYISNAYHFFPLEPSFDIKIFAGSFYDATRHDGSLVVQFRLGLKSLGIKEIANDSVGCSTQVNISEYLRFLNELEKEIKAV